MRTSLAIVVQMASFHFRFHWMLSSLVQQVGELPQMSIRVDTNKDDPYKSKTSALAKVFDSLLDIDWVEHGDEFAPRGNLRSAALSELTTDWILYSDADMLYPPQFFSDAKPFLCGEYADAVMSVQRLRTTRESAAGLITKQSHAEHAEHVEPVEDAYGKALTAYHDDPWRTSVARATGYFQLCNRVESIKRGSYTQNKPSLDIPLRAMGGGETFSDVQFRRGRRVVDVKLTPLVHLTHPRRWKNEWKGECL